MILGGVRPAGQDAVRDAELEPRREQLQVERDLPLDGRGVGGDGEHLQLLHLAGNHCAQRRDVRRRTGHVLMQSPSLNTVLF